MALLLLGAASCGSEDDLGAPIQKVTAPINSTFNGHDYSVYMTPAGWRAAQIICLYTGAHIASASNATENTFIAGQAAQHGGGAWWIGFNDITTEGTWKWNGNDPVTFTNWATGAPAMGINFDDCAAIDPNTTKWDDIDCGTSLPFVCERDAGPLPTTGFRGYSGNDTIDATRNYTDIPIDLNNNDGLTIGTCGMPAATFSGDTFLRLYAPNNTTQIAFNDDSCAGVGSNFSVVVHATGRYHIHAGCYFDTACNATLTWRREPQPPPSPFPPPP